MERHFWVAFALLILLSPFIGCSSSHNPTEDNTPPKFEFFLNINRSNSTFCSDAAKYSINPLPSSDNETERSNLLVRWDFGSDGEWDTDFEEVAYIDDYLPNPIPQQDWVVTGEMKDQAGNSVQKTVAIDLPSWMPEIPDIVAGELRVETLDPNSSDVDTLRVSEMFTIFLGRRDWVNDPNAFVVKKYYIDNVLVAENNENVSYPNPHSCSINGRTFGAGQLVVGTHEFRIEVGLGGGAEERNADNNSASKIVYVIE